MQLRLLLAKSCPWRSAKGHFLASPKVEGTVSASSMDSVGGVKFDVVRDLLASGQKNSCNCSIPTSADLNPVT